jgi:hypothetical protein
MPESIKKELKIRRKWRGFEGLSIDTTHIPPALPLDSTFSLKLITLVLMKQSQKKKRP